MPSGIYQRKSPSELTRKKISSTLMGHEVTEESRNKMRFSQMGNKNALGKSHGPHSEERKRKISESMVGKNLGKKLKPFSEETKKRMSLARIKSPNRVFKNTKIELKVQQLLQEVGIEFETNYPILGRPDIFIKPNICIFADGCYWHGCPTHYPKENTIKVERDRLITLELQKQGYLVIRLWEHEINLYKYS